MPEEVPLSSPREKAREPLLADSQIRKDRMYRLIRLNAVGAASPILATGTDELVSIKQEAKNLIHFTQCTH